MKINLSKSDINMFNASANSQGFTVNSESFYEAVDLISEGPIEGLTDSFGNALNYIDLSSSVSTQTNGSLAYGVYFNDVSIKDRKSNLFNISSSDFSLSLGSETSNIPAISSSVYEYKTKIYDLNKSIPEFSKVDEDKISPNYILTSFNESATDDPFLKSIIDLKNNARVFSHYLKNKYANLIKVIISLDDLYYVAAEGTNFNNTVRFVISLTNSFKQKTEYLLFQGYIIAKQNSVLLTFELEIDKYDKLDNINSEFVVNIYSVQQRIPASGPRKGVLTRSFSVNSIIEIVNYNFSYPFSAICRNKVSSKHFSSVPVRSFDCKLLKIAVPDNYDSESKEYSGDWSGNYSKSLRWSDNPAWIFHDLCINGRYGLAKSILTENDINKWELYKISKYCDELVKTNCSTKYTPQDFYFNNSFIFGQEGFNTIQITTTDDIFTLQNKYPFGGTLFLYDIKNEIGEDLNLNVKKVIGAITTNGSIATINLYNDFGPRKFIESDLSGNFFVALKEYILKDPSLLNTQDKIKTFAVSYISGYKNTIANFASTNEAVSIKYASAKIFNTSLKVKSGKCVARQEGFSDFLEQRFAANILINSETEGLRILSDLASIFRGVFYFKNGYLNLTSDVKKPVSYVFNNSNVKDGFFTYSSSNLNTAFSVIKVSYLDQLDNFKDKIVYIEDANLIQKFGIIEKEILGFGITSKYQAQRVGKWFLSTGKLESQIVNFNGGIEMSLLKVGDIIRISDDLKNSNINFGRITSLDYKNSYVGIDREVSENALGSIIKIFSLVENELSELSYYVSEVDNANLKLKLINFAYISWDIVSKVISSDDGKTVYADGIGTAGWTRKAFTKQSYINNCQISFKVTYDGTYLVCGLSEINNTTVDQTDINYGLYIAAGSLYSVENINNTTTTTNLNKTVVSTDILSVVYDGSSIIYYYNNEKLRNITRAKGNALYGVVAFNTPYARINDVNFSLFPDLDYGSFSNLRSDASFSIYLNDYVEDGDLYRITNIGENSANEYSIAAMKYSYEKFDFIEKDEYVDISQDNKKEIIFSTDTYISSAFTDSQVQIFFTQGLLFDQNINYLTSINSNYDYSFSIENETLDSGFAENKFKQLTIDFENIFNSGSVSTNPKVHGLYCIITKDGKTLKFKILRSEAKFIKLFLGETPLNRINFNPQYSIDFYAFDQNMKLINV
jgi:hypothetical protein